jgi:hypothetical protein
MMLYFTDAPEIALTFGKSLEIANSSWIRQLIRQQIDGAIGGMLVLPNVMNINWGNAADPTYADGAVSFQKLMPCALVRICVVQARDLATESSMFKKAPDAFAQISLGSDVRRTGVRSERDPVWGDVFDMLMYDEQQRVMVEVFDQSVMGTSSIGAGSSIPKNDEATSREDDLCANDLGPAASPKPSGSSASLAGRVANTPHAATLKTVIELAKAGERGLWLDLGGAPGGAQSQVQLRAEICDLSSNHNLLKRYLGQQGDVQHMIIDTTALVDQTEIQTGGCATKLCAPVAAVGSGAGAAPVALLVCEVFGGFLPNTIAAADKVQCRLRMGQVQDTLPCSPFSSDDAFSVLPEKTKKAIESFAASGVKSNVIATAMGEDEIEVARTVRRSGQNLKCPGRFSILLRPSDFHNQKTGARNDVEIALTMLGKDEDVIAMGTVSLDLVWDIDRYNNLVDLQVKSKSDAASEKTNLDIEMRLFAIAIRDKVQAVVDEE